ncbi:hypothetical protein IWW46_005775, partial [Coemansia sp. RSA 2440]
PATSRLVHLASLPMPSLGRTMMTATWRIASNVLNLLQGTLRPCVRRTAMCRVMPSPCQGSIAVALSWRQMRSTLPCYTKWHAVWTRLSQSPGWRICASWPNRSSCHKHRMSFGGQHRRFLMPNSLHLRLLTKICSN